MGQSICDLQESDQSRVLWRQRSVFVLHGNSAAQQAAPKQQDGNAAVGKVGEQEGRAGLLLRRQSGRLVELLHPRSFDCGSINTYAKLRSPADSLLRDTTWPAEAIRDSKIPGKGDSNHEETTCSNTDGVRRSSARSRWLDGWR